MKNHAMWNVAHQNKDNDSSFPVHSITPEAQVLIAGNTRRGLSLFIEESHVSVKTTTS